MHREPSFAAFITNVGCAQGADPAKLQTMVALHDTPGPEPTLDCLNCRIAAFFKADIQRGRGISADKRPGERKSLPFGAGAA